MTYDLSINCERKLVHVILYGPYSVCLLDNLINRINRNKGYEKSFSFLIDFSGVEFSPCDKDMSVLSDLIFREDVEYPAKVARVIKDMNIREFFEQLSSEEEKRGYTSRIFRKERDALDWINSANQ